MHVAPEQRVNFGTLSVDYFSNMIAKITENFASRCTFQSVNASYNNVPTLSEFTEATEYEVKKIILSSPSKHLFDFSCMIEIEVDNVYN